MESLYPELSIGMCPFRIEECWAEICKQKQEIEDFQTQKSIPLKVSNH
jgi:hypothetical protein